MLSYGCPFSDPAGMIRFLKGNVRRRKDWLTVSHGPEGSGKSTTTGQVIRRLDPSFDMHDDTIFDTRHLLDEMVDARKGQVRNIDEAINIFHNQDWATWKAKALSKIIRQMRIMRSTWFLNVPDYEGLHPYLRDYRVRLRYYHRPVFDADGMGNHDPIVLWKDERFDYKEQRVTDRWVDLEMEMQIDSLDDDPRHAEYEQKKEDNFIQLVQDMIDRLNIEDERLEADLAKAKKAARKAKRSVSPPTTT